MTRELDLQVAMARGDTFLRDKPNPYSTSIAVAWELVEEMANEASKIDGSFELSYFAGEWFVDWQTYEWRYLKSAETACEAICKCYLEWKGQ